MERQTSLEFEIGYCKDGFFEFLNEKTLVCIKKQTVECYSLYDEDCLAYFNLLKKKNAFTIE